MKWLHQLSQRITSMRIEHIRMRATALKLRAHTLIYEANQLERLIIKNEERSDGRG